MIYRILIILLFPLIGFSQNTIGLPDVINYYKGTYGAGLQNWDIRQDKNGIIYIANNEGLLSFDGRYWNLYPLPNKTIVRSIEIAADNKIYVGGQDEMGFFAPGVNGKLQYTSITGFIPEKDRTFGDVWDIISLKNDMAAPASVTAVRTTFGFKFFPAEMSRPCPSLSGTAVNFYIVNKVRSAHIFIFLCVAL